MGRAAWLSGLHRGLFYQLCLSDSRRSHQNISRDGGFQSLYCFYSTYLLGSQPRSQEGAWLLWTRHGTKRACTSEGHPDPLAHQVLVWRLSDVQSRLMRGRSPSGQSYQRGCPEEEAGRLQLQALCVLHEWGHTRGLMEHTPSQGVFREI